MKKEIKIVAFSDTHGHHRTVEVPNGDVLVFAGDLMTCGRKFSEVRDFADWFMKQPHEYKILVAGNHDRFFEHSLETCLAQFTSHPGYFRYLQDSGVQIRGWEFWGSPYQPEFYNWAFNKYRGPDIKKHWDKIPLNTDILITHGPPLGYGDHMGSLYGNGEWNEARVGCADLMDRVREVKPAVHFFGHIHNGRGMYLSQDKEPELLRANGEPIVFSNVAICDEAYEPNGNCHTMWLGERE